MVGSVKSRRFSERLRGYVASDHRQRARREGICRRFECNLGNTKKAMPRGELSGRFGRRKSPLEVFLRWGKGADCNRRCQWGLRVVDWRHHVTCLTRVVELG